MSSITRQWLVPSAGLFASSDSILFSKPRRLRMPVIGSRIASSRARSRSLRRRLISSWLAVTFWRSASTELFISAVPAITSVRRGFNCSTSRDASAVFSPESWSPKVPARSPVCEADCAMLAIRRSISPLMFFIVCSSAGAMCRL